MEGKYSFLKEAGKITVATGVFALLAIAALSTVGVVSSRASAGGSASTTVRVLNTPPQFWASGHVHEAPAYATSTPLVNGTTATWNAQAYDTGSDSIWLLICDNASVPTASSSSAPVCVGGASHQLGISAAATAYTYSSTTYVTVTASGAISTSSENVAWYGFLCDNNSGLPLCSAVADQGTAGNGDASPLVVHHPFTVTGITNDGPKNPTQPLTYSTVGLTQSPVDTLRGQDKAYLYICKTAAFSTSSGCTGGTWASSTVPVPNAGVATATINLTAPWAWGPYNAYPYILDTAGATSSSAALGTLSAFTVNNVAPTTASSSIAFSSSTLVLSNPLGLTPGFTVNFQTSDNNGCTTQGGATETPSVEVDLFPSASSTSCVSGSAAAFNPNFCYTSAAPTSSWPITCAPTSCNTVTTNWSCSFSLWSNADPTATSTPRASDLWDARITPTDSSGSSTSQTTANASQRPQVLPFNFLDLSSYAINYGAFQPGYGNASTSAQLTVLSEGNTALNISVLSSNMCPSFVSSSTDCSGNESLDTILGTRQHFSMSSSTLYGAAASSSTSTPQALALAIRKPTATGTYTSKDMFWGIFVPGTLTTSGDYKGVNTIFSVMQTNTSLW